MRTTVTVPMLLLGTFLLLGGCAGRQSPTRADRARELTEEGWTLFARDDFDGALIKFDEALAELSEYPDAHLGRGWALAFQREFYEARFALVTARELDDSEVDTWAGGAFVFSQMGDHDQVVAWAETALGIALQQGSNWSFSRYSGIDHRHLRWTLAQAYWYRGSWAQCSTQLDVLEAGIDHGLDPQTLLGHLQRLWLSPF
jgi:tetratricopeptide (TPR) repeat protein